MNYYLFKLFLERVTHVLRKIFQLPNERDLNSPKLKIEKRNAVYQRIIIKKIKRE